MSFERNVFVNCPLDDDYRALLGPILFTVCYLGFEAKIASENCDSGLPRLEKILTLIRESKYAIHDISRLRAVEAGDYFRLNMPFELGLDFGCRVYGSGRMTEKRFLILEAERYRYQAALSDLAGTDIQVHGNDPETVVGEVRDWLASFLPRSVDGPKRISSEFSDFTLYTLEQLEVRGHSVDGTKRMKVHELKRRMRCWLRSRRSGSRRLARQRRRRLGAESASVRPAD